MSDFSDDKWKLLLKSVARQDPSYKSKPTDNRSPQPKKHKKPEKLVEKDCLDWALKNQIFLHVVESKAVFSQGAGRYLSGQAQSGFPDIVGNNNDGQVLWIELKAIDRRCTLSPLQYIFLKTKIEQNCFAVVVDSADRLHEYYYTWKSSKNPISYLSSLLPVPKQIREDLDEPLF
jgi:hypothetical protein